MAPAATATARSSPKTKNRMVRNNRNRAGTSKLIGGKVPNFQSTMNDSVSSGDNDDVVVVVNGSTIIKKKAITSSNNNHNKKQKKQSDDNESSSSSDYSSSSSSDGGSSRSSSSSGCSDSSSNSSSSSSSSSSDSSDESDGGWSSSNNDFSSSHNDDDDGDDNDDANEMKVLRSTIQNRIAKSQKKDSTNKAEKNNAADDGLLLLSDDDDDVDMDVMVDDEYLSDALLREDAGSSTKSYSSLSLRQQQEEPLHLSYDFDGVHLEGDESNSSSGNNNNTNDGNQNNNREVPSSVAIALVDTDSQQAQGPSCFDVSDPSIDDSISKNYDARYDGSLKDLTNCGNKSADSLQLTDVSSYNNNDNSNSSNDDDDVNEMKGYLSSTSEKQRGIPNVLLQPYVGERPPTPPSPVRKMIKKTSQSRQQQQDHSNSSINDSSGSKNNYTTTSPIKTVTAVIRSPSKNEAHTIPFAIMNDDLQHANHHQQQEYEININDDLFGKLSYDDPEKQQRQPLQSPRTNSNGNENYQLNKQFDDFYPVEYGKNDETECRNHIPEHKLLDVSIQKSCKYSNNHEDADEEHRPDDTIIVRSQSPRRTNHHRLSIDNNGVDTVQGKDNDHHNKDRRTIRRLFIALICALIALLAALGGIIVLVLDQEEGNSMTGSSQNEQRQNTLQPVASPTAPSQAPITVITSSAPVIQLPTTNTSPNSNIFNPVPVTVPAPTNPPMARNATASLINTPYAASSPATAPTTRAPVVLAVVVPVPPPTAVNATAVTTAPTIASVQIP